MRISSWMESNNGGHSRLTGGELDVIFLLAKNNDFIDIIETKKGENFLISIKNLVWNLDEVFGNIFIMIHHEKFKNICKEKSIQEGLEYFECMKREVCEYVVSPDEIVNANIIESVTFFLVPRLKILLEEIKNKSDEESIDIIKNKEEEIFKEALELIDIEAKIECGNKFFSFTDGMKFRKNLNLAEFNAPFDRPEK